MKKQNDPKKTKHHRVYDDTKTTGERRLAVINSIPEHCWWLRQYLQATLFARKGRVYARD